MSHSFKVYIVYSHCAIFCMGSWVEVGTNLYGGCVGIVQVFWQLYNILGAISTSFPWKLNGAHTWLPCNLAMIFITPNVPQKLCICCPISTHHPQNDYKGMIQYFLQHSYKFMMFENFDNFQLNKIIEDTYENLAAAVCHTQRPHGKGE